MAAGAEIIPIARAVAPVAETAKRSSTEAEGGGEPRRAAAAALAEPTRKSRLKPAKSEAAAAQSRGSRKAAPAKAPRATGKKAQKPGKK
jgi:hypothetical protein